MRIVLIGGGVFPGAAFVQAERARGPALTVFNRSRARCDRPDGGKATRAEATGLVAADPRRKDKPAPAREAELLGR
jgi:hypothetical protein